MYYRTKRKWAFFTADASGKYTLYSERDCKVPHWTKDFKAIAKLLSDKEEVKRAGCCLSEDYHLNYV